MSDSDSLRSASPARNLGNTNPDEVLDDHRYQEPSLPARNSSSAIPARNEQQSSAIESDDSDNEDPLSTRSGVPQRRLSQPPSNANVPRTYVTDAAGNLRPDDGTSRPQRNYMNSLRREFLLNNAEDYVDPYDDPTASVAYMRGTPGSLATAARRGRAGGRSHSFSEQIKSLVHPIKGHARPEETNRSGLNPAPTSISRKGSSAKKYKRTLSTSETEMDPETPVTRSKTAESGDDGDRTNKKERRPSRSSIDSEADSHASRSSQETEEDVCFPMLREHVRINGIDFDEIEDFIKAEREEERLMKEQQQSIAEKTAFRVGTRDAKSTGTNPNVSHSAAALKYTPKNILNKTVFSKNKNSDETSIRTINDRVPSDLSTEDDYLEKGGEDSSTVDQVKFGGTRITADNSSSLPDRFSFFSSESEETVHAPDIPSLVEPGQTVRDLFRNGEETWWLDCVCPTDAEMKMLAKAFGIHPLTAEDIRMQETREKVELFRNYYFVCFHTFEPDSESEDYLEPINVYLVVFKEGVLTFHFSPIAHPANVRRRVRQLRDYVDVSADWLCYALIDDITDGFAPVITGIEYEADAIEDSVFVTRDMDFSSMLQRVGESRRKVMTVMRLLSGKADVIKMFAKRCQDEIADYTGTHDYDPRGPAGHHGGVGGVSFGRAPGASSHNFSNQWHHGYGGIAQPRADIALYLGDIQDHVVTMFQNLLAYEKIFGRSHANYLAQLQVESFYSNLNGTAILSKVTIIGTVLLPLNVITGMFGMNVTVPGEAQGNLHWFFGIVGVMVLIASCCIISANYWLNSSSTPIIDRPVPSSRRSIRSMGLRRGRGRDPAKSILSFPNKYE